MDDPDYAVDDARADRGAIVYGIRCTACHGFMAVSSGAAPDLRASSAPCSAETFRNIVKEGTLMAAGMPRFAELGDSDLDDVRQYLRSRAQAWRSMQSAVH